MLKKILGLLLGALTVCLITPFVGSTPAYAAASFTYTFEGKCCINSRQFDSRTEADVTISLGNMSPCDSISGDRPDIRMSLKVSDFGGDTTIGNDKTIVDCSGTARWVAVNARDNMYIRMTILYPHRDTRIYNWSGRVTYD